VVRDLLPKSITLGVQTGHSTGGHTPWTDAQVLAAERSARSDISKAITLGANTGQRVSDLVRMGPTDIEIFKGARGINVTQQKTGRQIWIPITDALAVVMESWERRPGPFLLKRDGRPWKSHDLTCVWDLEKRRNELLAEHRRLGLVLHGLRGHACVRLSRQGLTDHQVGDVVGMSAAMVGRYTRLSAQKENALAAVLSLSRHKSLKIKS
jgi:integrase